MLSNSRLQTIICCSSRDVSKNFYVDKLGLSLTRRSFNGFILDAGGGDLCLCEIPDARPSAHTIVDFAVACIEAVTGELEAHGIAIERIEGLSDGPTGIGIAPDGSKVAWLRDPDGNLVSIVQYADGLDALRRGQMKPGKPWLRLV